MAEVGDADRARYVGTLFLEDLISQKRAVALEAHLCSDEQRNEGLTSDSSVQEGVQEYKSLGATFLRGIMLGQLTLGDYRVISTEFYGDCIIIRWTKHFGGDVPVGVSWLSLRDDVGNTYTPVAASVNGLATYRGETVFVPGLSAGSVLTLEDDAGHSVDIHVERAAAP
ncbi:MAG: hypothetical protein LC749_09160 [Actinobacteria bacterium]|nr:hypothetical protein [Actinomycetota bacterium]